MITEKDIYTHLKNGGSLEELHKALAKDIDKIQKQIDDEIVAKKREQELTNKKLKARTAAFAAMKAYFALANKDINDEIINSVLDTLESLEITFNNVRDKKSRGDLYDIFGLFR